MDFQAIRHEQALTSLLSNCKRVYDLPPDIGAAKHCSYKLVAVNEATREFCDVDPWSKDVRERFEMLKKMDCALYYSSTDHGCYTYGFGKHQRLYDAVTKQNVPHCGYPKLEMYDDTMAEVIAVVYMLLRIQHEWYNNGFINVDPWKYRFLVHDRLIVSNPSNLHKRVGFCYFRMVKYLADTHKMPHATAVMDAYRDYYESWDETSSTPPSDVEYDSDEKYERGKDSDYDSDVAFDENEKSYRARKIERRNEFYDWLNRERDDLNVTLQSAIEKHVEGIGVDVMSYVRGLLSAEQISQLEDAVPDPSKEATFNCLGVCTRPGLYGDEHYCFGELKRLSKQEVEQEAKRQKRAMLYDESKRARASSVLAAQRMRELEEKGKREEEEFRKRMEDMRAERAQLEASMLTHDADARQKMDEANSLAKC